MLEIRLKPFAMLCVAVAELLNFSTADSNYGPCTTPNRISATCVKLEDCSYLYNLVKNPNLSENDVKFLRASQCGYFNGSILICCPQQYRAEEQKDRRPTVPHNPYSTTGPVSSYSGGLLPSFPNCGKSLGSRIYGGVETEIGEYPWLALVEYTQPSNEKGHYCGGSLINDRYVLTAAHCVSKDEIPSDWRVTAVRLGEWDTKADPDCDESGCAPTPQDIGIAEVIQHSGYTKPNGPNDIALLRLARAVNMSEYVMPICLPTQPNLRSDTFIDASMDVAGWGKTETTSASTVQLKTAVKVKDLAECQKKYIQILNGIILEPSQLCAGGNAGNDSCRGDSGGPLMFQDKINNQAVYLLTGVVSFGPTPCGLEGWPGVYTRVGAFIDWIESKIKP